MSKHFYWVVEGTVGDDGEVKWNHADDYWFSHADGFPNGFVLHINDEFPLSGHWDFVRDEEIDEDEFIWRDLQSRLRMNKD